MNLREVDYLHIVEAARHQMSGLFEDIRIAYTRPSMVHKLMPFKDGNQWCVLLGTDLQTGICGFGDSPEKACADFDAVWTWGYSKNQPKSAPVCPSCGGSAGEPKEMYVGMSVDPDHPYHLCVSDFHAHKGGE